jgi:hypothetical protein
MWLDDVLIAVIVGGTFLAIAYIRAEFQLTRRRRVGSGG